MSRLVTSMRESATLFTVPKWCRDELTEAAARITHLEAQLEKARGLAAEWNAKSKQLREESSYGAAGAFEDAADELTAILQPTSDEAGSA